MLIGTSISEAIDWTQDMLGSTRPDAERTLFALCESKRVVETDEGFVLLEAEAEEDNEEREARLKAALHHIRGRAIRRFSFHKARARPLFDHQMHAHHLKHNRISPSDAAADMIDAELDDDRDES